MFGYLINIGKDPNTLFMIIRTCILHIAITRVKIITSVPLLCVGFSVWLTDEIIYDYTFVRLRHGAGVV